MRVECEGWGWEVRLYCLLIFFFSAFGFGFGWEIEGMGMGTYASSCLVPCFIKPNEDSGCDIPVLSHSSNVSRYGTVVSNYFQREIMWVPIA